ncbi:MAG: hypothetical protein LBD75_07545 [Candidatus Peribacteria bacterium]|jgi:MFS-type transporter involved in bile tolerance (Atg22 family)|nr:hypothetical protein [Candidatus Peribacteria bacterium]
MYFIYNITKRFTFHFSAFMQTFLTDVTAELNHTRIRILDTIILLTGTGKI